ncbi:uncharacterized protein METZ01_LOCUS440131 [marine metagenome]|uniref:Uncharacterized protein n=1 Tax=marine metagenome TaxID=408172 RepID=A0A382YVI6_9ZZZZ
MISLGLGNVTVGAGKCEEDKLTGIRI